MNGRSLIIIACCFAVTIAAPLEDDQELARAKRQLQTPPKFNFQPPTSGPNNKRFELTNLQAGGLRSTRFDVKPNPNDKRFEITNLHGGGSRSTGFDVNAAGRVKAWESRNGLNQIHGSGSYNQHLGGPWGNSKPNIGGGISFTRHF